MAGSKIAAELPQEAEHVGEDRVDTSFVGPDSQTLSADNSSLPRPDAPELGDLSLSLSTIMSVLDTKRDVNLDAVVERIEDCLHTSWIDWNVQEQELMDTLLAVPDHQMQELLDRFGGKEVFLSRLEDARAFKPHELSILKHKVHNAISESFDAALAATALYDAATDQSGWDAGTVQNVRQIVQDLDKEQLGAVLAVLHERDATDALTQRDPLEQLGHLLDNYLPGGLRSVEFDALLNIPDEDMAVVVEKFGGPDKFLQCVGRTGEFADHELSIIAHKVKNASPDSFDANVAAQALVDSATDDSGWDLGVGHFQSIFDDLTDEQLKQVIDILDEQDVDLGKRMRDHAYLVRVFESPADQFFTALDKVLGREKRIGHYRGFDGRQRLEIQERLAMVDARFMPEYVRQLKRAMAGISTLDRAIVKMDAAYIDEVEPEQLAGSLSAMDLQEVKRVYGPDFPRDLYNKFSSEPAFQHFFFQKMYGANAGDVIALQRALAAKDPDRFVQRWNQIDPQVRDQVRSDLEDAFGTEYGGGLIAGICKYLGKSSYLDVIDSKWEAGLDERLAWANLINTIEPELLPHPENVADLNPGAYQSLRDRITACDVNRNIGQVLGRT